MKTINNNTEQTPPFQPGKNNWAETINPLVFETFSCELAKRISNDATVVQTTFREDGGVDFYAFNNTDNKKVTHGEVKRLKTAGVKEFARSVLSVLLNENSDKLIIITTSKINLNAYQEIHRVLATHFKSFQLYHRASLICLYHKRYYNDLFKKYKLNEVLKCNLPNEYNDLLVHFNYKIENNSAIHQNDNEDDHYIEINTEGNKSRTYELSENESLILNFVVENYSNSDTELTAIFYRDEDWWLDFTENAGRGFKGPSNKFIVPANGQLFIRCVMRLRYACKTHIPSVVLRHLRGNKIVTLLIDKNVEVQPKLIQPPISIIHTKSFKAISNFLSQAVNKSETPGQNNKYSNVLLVKGESGTGKTQVVNEACGELFGLKNIYFKVDEDSSFVTLLELINKHSVFLEKESSNIKEISDGICYPLIVVIDDLYKAKAQFLENLSNCIKKTENKNLLFICIVRNDDTYNPDDLNTFINHISNQAAEVEIQPLENALAGKLIQSILPNVTHQAQEQILLISEGKISFILATIEQLYNEQPLSVIAAKGSYYDQDERFYYSSRKLPEIVKKDLTDRFKQIDTDSRGFLTALALLSSATSDLDSEIPHILVEKFNVETKLDTLIKRKQLVVKFKSGKEHSPYSYALSHPNIQHALTSQDESDKEVQSNLKSAAENIASIYSDTKINDKRTLFEKLRIGFYAKHDTDMLKQLIFDAFIPKNHEKKPSKLGNPKIQFSDLDISDLSYLPNTSQLYYALEFAQENEIFGNFGLIKCPEDCLNKINLIFLKLHCAMFTQNYHQVVSLIERNLETTLRDFEKTIKKKNDSEKGEWIKVKDNLDIKLLKLRQLAGHAQQNCSMIDSSTSYLLKVIASINGLSADSKDAEMKELQFQAYDRMRKNAIYKGDIDDAKNYFQASKKLTSKDPERNALLEMGEGELTFVKDTSSSFNTWKNAKNAMDKCRNKRILFNFDLIKLQETILKYNKDDREKEDRVIENKLSDLNYNMDKNDYLGPRPKIPLLEGIFHLKQNKIKNSIDDFESSYNEAEKSGYGVFLWLSLNNKAIALWNSGDTGKALKMFKAALSKAQRQGFLNYLHTGSVLFFQQALIKNCLNFAKEYDLYDFTFDINKLIGIDIKETKCFDNIYKKPADEVFLHQFRPPHKNYNDKCCEAYLMTFI